ncbi:hypothetical protein LMG31886_36840 [Xanthomonas hydrangeae]|nr:hypothetical protein LMG31884_37780 [Xanthomonas hydrangeae]CAD7725000.1 hypothetical protein LMG31884_37780 [Xanthomonas hydrangeae]CAD7735700.1 hypothetical protein LMG31885_23560 [Xanthomonas hydrangeae]CAD7735703.1 hypothetical protein LMG31885_23560 [Xanthomonas hydrangeae]CAD7741292.1 hypothetical protein LMG31887_37690 [Xanthomonas hydrangeae]
MLTVAFGVRNLLTLQVANAIAVVLCPRAQKMEIEANW